MTLKLYCDGGLNGKKNPSPEGVYWSVAMEKSNGEVVLLTERAKSFDHFTNNDAEYLALIEALGHAAVMADGHSHVVVHSDSQLIVNQFNGRWKITGDRLKGLCTHAQHCAEFLTKKLELAVIWVPRSESVRTMGH